MQTKQAPPQAITASVLLIVSGCIVAGLGDFSFDMKGCVYNCNGINVHHTHMQACETLTLVTGGHKALILLQTLEIVTTPTVWLNGGHVCSA